MKIKALVMDVDGTLTDGGIYIGSNGEEFKKFYVRDGHAIKHFLPLHGIRPIIITGRESEIVNIRCKELDIADCVQGCQEKKNALVEILNKYQISPDETAYIGDDVNDLECMEFVGVVGCPNNAIEQIKNKAQFVSQYNGGQGAVRDFIEWIISHEKSINFEWNN